MNHLRPGPRAPALIRRVLRPIVELREGESTTAAAMFAYSFLAMTAYNIIKPITRSKFISDLGADNLPWVQLAAGLLVGLIMHGYAHALTFIPRRWTIPATQAGCVILLLVFWALFAAGYDAASVAFYVLGLILGILLISQFWTLANDIYDARHAKRLFGFIGGGASLGGATGAAITAATVNRVGTVNLLLVGAAVMGICFALVLFIIRREEKAGTSLQAAVEAEGVGGAEAIRLLRESRHLQLIAMIIGCAAVGAVIIEQQLNMAAEARLGQDADGITRFLAQVTVYLSLAGFLVQVTLTSRIHTMLGIGFAMLILPVGLGTTAVVMLFNSGLWAPAFARVLDSSLRYTVDKTTREILFLPLPASLKYRAKPFVDVTMDRFAKGLGALALLVCIKPWGFALTWQQLSFVSLTLMAAWVWLAARAKREYLGTFRRSLAHGDVAVADLRAPHADLQTIELLVEELAHLDEERVLYAIDLLDSLDKRHLITPLLLHHSSARVRARALAVVEGLQPARAARWLPAVERLLGDDDAGVRTGVVRAMFAIRGAEAAALLRQHLDDSDPRIAAAAGAVLMASDAAADVEAARSALYRLASNTRDSGIAGRLAVARALGDVPQDACRELLVPLLLDTNVDVAREAIRSAGRLGPDWPLFVPPLVSLLRHRMLKNEARTVLIGCGERIVDVLTHFLKDPAEDVWVRRHLPATLAHLPGQHTMDVLIDRLSDPDGFLRYKAIAAIEKVHQTHPELVIRRDAVERLALAENRRYFNALTLHANLTRNGGIGADTLLVRALEEKQPRSRDRVFRLLGLLYSHTDMRAARFALDHSDAARRASAAEYLDNVLTGALRKRVLLMVDDMPAEERVRRTNVLFHTRPRTPEDTLAQLIHDDDPVVAACAIHLAAERGMWQLTDDIEFARTHRDPPDGYVLDAASAALAASRAAAAGPRSGRLAPLAAVELADRLCQMPLFDYVSVDELFRVASTARQIRYDHARVVFDAGQVPDTLQFLIDGVVRFSDATTATAPVPLAFEELLTGRPVAQAIHTVDAAVTLSLTRDEFLTLLSDNIDVVHRLFRMVMDRRGGQHWWGVTGGVLPGAAVARAEGLSAMERALLLRASPLLAGVTSGQLLRLAMVAVEEPLVPGAVIAREGDDPAIRIVLRGEVELDVPTAPGGSSLVARPGDAIGLYETLADLPIDARATVSEAGIALRTDGRDLFDLLAMDVDLLQGLFAVLLRRDAGVSGVESAIPAPRVIAV